MHILAISPGQGFDRIQWRRILSSGVDAFMIREKILETRTIWDATRWVQDTFPHLTLWVNERLDVALAAGCGFHAPEAYPDVPLGLTSLSRPIHGESQFSNRLASQQLLISPIFPTPHKSEPWGIPRLHLALNALPETPTHLLALGGVTPERIKNLRHPRLQGVALIRALWEAQNPKATVEACRMAWQKPMA